MGTAGKATTAAMVYATPPAGRAAARGLVVVAGPETGRRFVFYDYIEIGRLEAGQGAAPGKLRIADETVSARHCVITQDGDGRCWVRDTSTNGTRIDHHRLVPGAESAIYEGQMLSLGLDLGFRLDAAESEAAAPGASERRTKLLPSWLEATVVVGDIAGYTGLVREAPQETLQASVSVLFHELTQLVAGLDGTVKEYSGDAILAYWEADGSENCAIRACRSALLLNDAAIRLGADGTVWRLEDRPLRMDWALASGKVLVHSMGGPHPVGLSMLGAPVVLAYRLEKVAGDRTGPILACAETRRLAGGTFRFRDLGARALEGIAAPQPVFALEGEA